MKCLTAVALMAVLAVGLGACDSSSSGGAVGDGDSIGGSTDGGGGGGGSGGGGSQGGDGRCLTASNGHRWCDETDQGGFDLASAYKISKQVCKTFGFKSVAKEYHAASDPVSAAQAYSKDYQAGARQAAFEGCLDGFG